MYCRRYKDTDIMRSDAGLAMHMTMDSLIARLRNADESDEPTKETESDEKSKKKQHRKPRLLRYSNLPVETFRQLCGQSNN